MVIKPSGGLWRQQGCFSRGTLYRPRAVPTRAIISAPARGARAAEGPRRAPGGLPEGSRSPPGELPEAKRLGICA